MNQIAFHSAANTNRLVASLSSRQQPMHETAHSVSTRLNPPSVQFSGFNPLRTLRSLLASFVQRTLPPEHQRFELESKKETTQSRYEQDRDAHVRILADVLLKLHKVDNELAFYRPAVTLDQEKARLGKIQILMDSSTPPSDNDANLLLDDDLKRPTPDNSLQSVSVSGDDSTAARLKDQQQRCLQQVSTLTKQLDGIEQSQLLVLQNRLKHLNDSVDLANADIRQYNQLEKDWQTRTGKKYHPIFEDYGRQKSKITMRINDARDELQEIDTEIARVKNRKFESAEQKAQSLADFEAEHPRLTGKKTRLQQDFSVIHAEFTEALETFDTSKSALQDVERQKERDAISAFILGLSTGASRKNAKTSQTYWDHCVNTRALILSNQSKIKKLEKANETLAIEQQAVTESKLVAPKNPATLIEKNRREIERLERQVALDQALIKELEQVNTALLPGI